MALNPAENSEIGIEAAKRAEHTESVGGASSATLIRDLATTLKDLWSKEFELARTEAREGIAALRAAAVCVLLAAIPAFVSLVLIALAITYALDDVLPQWAAALLPAVVLAGVSAVMLAVGLKRLKGPEVAPDRTVSSLKKDKQWLKRELSGEA